MKSRLIALLGVAALTVNAFADDVAVVDIKNPHAEKPYRVVIEFFSDAAPRTVENFKKLARSNFYDGVAFHRIFPHLMVQAGDPLSKRQDRSAVGTGGPGYTLPPEFSRRKHTSGAVAAARLPDGINPGKLSNGSQFYIALAPLPKLDGQYTVFGHVAQGLDVLDALSVEPVDTNDNPVDRIVIQSVQIVPRESASAVKPKNAGGILKYFRINL